MAAGPDNSFLPDQAQAKHGRGRSPVGPRPTQDAANRLGSSRLPRTRVNKGKTGFLGVARSPRRH